MCENEHDHSVREEHPQTETARARAGGDRTPLVPRAQTHSPRAPARHPGPPENSRHAQKNYIFHGYSSWSFSKILHRQRVLHDERGKGNQKEV